MAISPAVTVAVENAGGNVITTDNSLVTLTISHGSFANGSTTVTAQAVSGVATFSNLVIDAAGSYNLTASDGALPPTQSNPFNIVAQATQLVFTQQPNNTYAGEAVNPSVAVSLEDGFGNVATAQYLHGDADAQRRDVLRRRHHRHGRRRERRRQLQQPGRYRAGNLHPHRHRPGPDLRHVLLVRHRHHAR